MVPSIPSFWTTTQTNRADLYSMTIIGQALHTETGESYYVAQLMFKAHIVVLITQKQLEENGYTQIDATRKNPNTRAMDTMPAPPGIFRHYKQETAKGEAMLYEVYGTAFLYEDRDRENPLVLYSPLYGEHEGKLTVRPYYTPVEVHNARANKPEAEAPYGFFDWVRRLDNDRGYAGPRFTYVKPMESSMHPLLHKPYITD